MRFAFTEDQLLFRDAARDVMRGECTASKLRAAWDSDDGRVPGLWVRLADVGVVGLTAAERWGGMGLGQIELCLVLEESGAVALPEPLVETTALGIPLLQDIGTDAIQDRWIGAAASGAAIIAVGIGEPYLLGAGEADLLLLERDGAVYALLRDRVRVEPVSSVDRARRMCEVDWAASDAELLAEAAIAAAAIERTRDRGALAAAAQLLGLGRRMIEMTTEHATTRKQFGRFIGSFQAVKHQLADAHVALELARPLVYRAAHSMAHDDPDVSVHVSMAKAHASEAAYSASRAALQCHGAIGYSYEYDLQLWMKRTWALCAAWGDAEFHRARIADHLMPR